MRTRACLAPGLIESKVFQRPHQLIYTIKRYRPQTQSSKICALKPANWPSTLLLLLSESSRPLARRDLHTIHCPPTTSFPTTNCERRTRGYDLPDFAVPALLPQASPYSTPGKEKKWPGGLTMMYRVPVVEAPHGRPMHARTLGSSCRSHSSFLTMIITLKTWCNLHLLCVMR